MRRVVCVVQRPDAFSAVSLVLCLQHRMYFWPYKEDFVPQGAKTSRMQSSNLSSQRIRVLTEYALAPVFGATSVCCTIGTLQTPMELSRSKKELRLVLSDILSLPPQQISFGPVVGLMQQQLHKPHDYTALRKSKRTGAVVATSIVDVIVSDDVDVDLVPQLGRRVLDALREGRPNASVEGGEQQVGSEGNKCSGKLLRAAGVTFVELPKHAIGQEQPDLIPTQICGVEVTDEMADQAVERWARRVAEVDA